MADLTDLPPFAKWLHEAAANAGYDFDQRGTAATFARDTGIDHAQISRFLSGSAKPKAPAMVKIARALDVKVEDIARRIAGDEDAQPAGDITRGQAFAALGVSDPEDQALILHLIDRLKNRGE